MSEHDQAIGSMFGFHIEKLPPVTHECREFEERSDKAGCAMCQTLIRKDLHHEHPDLKEPTVQAAVRKLFMELMQNDFESYSCPFPETERCPSLKRLKRPPRKK